MLGASGINKESTMIITVEVPFWLEQEILKAAEEKGFKMTKKDLKLFLENDIQTVYEGFVLQGLDNALDGFLEYEYEGATA